MRRPVAILGDLCGPKIRVGRFKADAVTLKEELLRSGDLDGARSMLEEVLAEGGPTAKAEAARLLKDMG